MIPLVLLAMASASPGVPSADPVYWLDAVASEPREWVVLQDPSVYGFGVVGMGPCCHVGLTKDRDDPPIVLCDHARQPWGAIRIDPSQARRARRAMRRRLEPFAPRRLRVIDHLGTQRLVEVAGTMRTDDGEPTWTGGRRAWLVDDQGTWTPVPTRHRAPPSGPHTFIDAATQRESIP